VEGLKDIAVHAKASHRGALYAGEAQTRMTKIISKEPTVQQPWILFTNTEIFSSQEGPENGNYRCSLCLWKRLGFIQSIVFMD
jgi:hypothetical protein